MTADGSGVMFDGIAKRYDLRSGSVTTVWVHNLLTGCRVTFNTNTLDRSIRLAFDGEVAKVTES